MTDERLRRWRLILGEQQEVDYGFELTETDRKMDGAISALYDAGNGNEKKGGLGASSPNVARWLGDIREYFPTSVVRVMQKDALERLNLQRMLLESEMLAAVEPDIHLVATLISLKSLIPARTKDTARMVVKRVVDELMKRLAQPTRQAVAGALNRSVRNRRPLYREIDWPRTIRANLRHYQEEYHTIIPETRIGYGRKRSTLRDIILCIDQSGSMASSVIYSGIFGAVIASLPSVSTKMVVFDTSVVDLTDELHDPVELLFGVQLGGGTDINRALSYCQSLVRRPQETILILISDLIEGGVREKMLRRMAALQSSGVQTIVLLALSDDGRPSYDHQIAEALAAMGLPAFACTPDLFPSLLAHTINRQDIAAWAATNGVVTAHGEKG